MDRASASGAECVGSIPIRRARKKQVTRLAFLRFTENLIIQADFQCIKVKQMKTLIFNGSPRTNGCTSALLKYFTDNLKGKITTINAYRFNASPCIDCRHCRTAVECIQQDAMQNLYGSIDSYDNIVIASPLYFSEISGPLLSVFSRFQPYFYSKYTRHETPFKKSKNGIIILTGGNKNACFDHAVSTSKIILNLLGASNIIEPFKFPNTDMSPVHENRPEISRLIHAASALSESI